MAAVLLLCACSPSTEPESLLEIVCFDVGQGDSTLLRTREGDILIDAGPEDAQDTLCHKLHSLGVESLALLILTHPDEDHVGGGDGVLREFPTDEVWVNGAEEESESYSRLTNAMRLAELTPRTVGAGDYGSFGDTVITVLAPRSGSASSGNEGSLVLLVRCGDFSMLLMGDAEGSTEKWLLQNYDPPQLQSDVLHVGHHGSNTSGTADFLEVVQAEYAVISCGAGNLYGHPDGRALTRLEAAGTEILRTDLLGDILIRVPSDGAGFSIS